MLLAPLRILYLQGHDLHLGGRNGRKLPKRPDGFRLVVLYADHYSFRPESTGQNPDTRQQLLAAFEHHPVVIRQVRFALHSIDNEELRLPTVRNGKLHLSRKGSPTHAYDSRSPHFGDYLLRRKSAFAYYPVARIDALHPFVRLRLYRHARPTQARRVEIAVDGRDRSRDRGMYVARNESGTPAYQLPRTYPFALRHHRFGGGSDVLRQRYRHRLRKGHGLDGAVPTYLTVRRMNTAYGKCFQHTRRISNSLIFHAVPALSPPRPAARTTGRRQPPLSVREPGNSRRVWLPSDTPARTSGTDGTC